MNQWPADITERRAVSALVPYARNARTHSAAQIQQIADSIREWGFTVPVLVDEDDEIIAGHGRVLGAQALGLETVPVMVARGWTPLQIRAYRIADNKIAMNSGWDIELLAAEMGDLQGLDSLIGFGEGELESLLRGESVAIPSPEVARLTLAERFGLPPFTVFNARDGKWQARKAAWIGLGIQSELGRGDTGVNTPREEGHAAADIEGLRAARARQKELLPNGGGMKSKKRYDATPGGSPRPAADYGKSHARGDGRGKAVQTASLKGGLTLGTTTDPYRKKRKPKDTLQ